MTRILLAVSLMLTFAGCASLAPREQRQLQFVENTTAPKATAYNRAMGYIAKNFGNSNVAIRMKDEASGQIILKGNVACNEMRQFGDTNDYFLGFNLDFQAKDNKVRFLFEDLEMLKKDGTSVPFANNQLTSAGDTEKVKPCIEPVRSGMLKAINNTGNDNW